MAVATFSRQLKTLITLSKSTYRWGKRSELWEEWEEEVAAVTEEVGFEACYRQFVLNKSVVQILGGAVVDFLHESLQEVVFISRDMSWTVKFSEDVVYCFKE
jgi:hypothetical protein